MTSKEFKENCINEKDLKELLDFVNNEKYPSKSFPNDKYNFSWDFARNILADNGLYETTKRKTQNENDVIENKILTMNVREDNKLTARSMKLENGILKRLDSFCEKYPFYSKGYIISQLLDEALNSYEENQSNEE